MNGAAVAEGKTGDIVQIRIILQEIEPFDAADMETDKVEAMLSRVRGGRRKGPRKGKA